MNFWCEHLDLYFQEVVLDIMALSFFLLERHQLHIRLFGPIFHLKCQLKKNLIFILLTVFLLLLNSFIIFAFESTVWWEPCNLLFISGMFFFSFLSLIYSDFIPLLVLYFWFKAFSSYPQTLVWGRFISFWVLCQFSSTLCFLGGGREDFHQLNVLIHIFSYSSSVYM